jgi:hypothetical protein
MVVLVVAIPIFWYTTLDNLRRTTRANHIATVLYRFHTAVLASWFLILAALVLVEFAPAPLRPK